MRNYWTFKDKNFVDIRLFLIRLKSLRRYMTAVRIHYRCRILRLPSNVGLVTIGICFAKTLCRGLLFYLLPSTFLYVSFSPSLFFLLCFLYIFLSFLMSFTRPGNFLISSLKGTPCIMTFNKVVLILTHWLQRCYLGKRKQISVHFESRY
jgi:hypothetical protein